MTYAYAGFNAFHWLPEENPANIVDISSDDDDDKNKPALPFPKSTDEIAKEAEPSAEARAASAAFRKAISTSIPIHLTDSAARQRIRGAGISMLEVAVSSGIPVTALFMDANCLPAWPYRDWDPEAQSLHQVIQSRLTECQDAEELGPGLQGAIVQLGNERLQEAVLLGLEIRDLTIGEDLLPTWENRGGNDPMDDDNDTIMDAESSVNSEDVPVLTTERVGGKATHAAAVHEHQPKSAWSSDSESSDSESEPEFVTDYDDEISLFNFVCQHPVIEEDDEEAPLRNIVHNVDVVGPSFAGSCPVDFEVYLAQDDPDIEQLPEVELAIDEEAFAHHYPMADVIDLELVDGGIYWVAPQEEEPDQEMEELAVPECTMGSPEEDGSLDEPMTPPGAGKTEVPAGWVVI